MKPTTAELFRIPFLFAIATALAFAPRIAQANEVKAIEITALPQTVVIDDDLAVFEAKVITDRDTSADGFLKLLFRSGKVVELKPIFARELPSDEPQGRKPLLIIAEDVDGEARANPMERFVIGTVTPDSTEVGCDIWDLVGGDVSGGTTGDRAQFEAASTRSRTRYDFPQHDFGQIPVAAAIYSPFQTVIPFDSNQPLEFGALAEIRRSNQAEGFIYAPLSKRGGVYEVCFGAVFPHPRSGYQIFMVGALPNASNTDDLLRATATPAAEVEDCLLWDLVNGSTGQNTAVRHTATFEAQSYVRSRQ